MTRYEALKALVKHERSVTIGLVVVIPILITIGLVACESRERDRALQKRDVLISQGFAQRDRALAEAVRQNCRDVEKLKSAERAAAQREWNNLDRSLELLGLEKTKAIVDAARERLQEHLKRFAPLPGGCAA